MKKLLAIFCSVVASSFCNYSMAQTDSSIRGSWAIVSTTITSPGGVFKMDSSTHTFIKIITKGRFIVSIYNKPSGSLVMTGHGLASTSGNKYTETFEASTSADLLKEPGVFTYQVTGNKLIYEGGTKNMKIREVLVRLE